MVYGFSLDRLWLRLTNNYSELKPLLSALSTSPLPRTHFLWPLQPQLYSSLVQPSLQSAILLELNLSQPHGSPPSLASLSLQLESPRLLMLPRKPSKEIYHAARGI